jgi:hypothetical protein
MKLIKKYINYLAFEVNGQFYPDGDLKLKMEKVGAKKNNSNESLSVR